MNTYQAGGDPYVVNISNPGGYEFKQDNGQNAFPVDFLFDSPGQMLKILFTFDAGQGEFNPDNEVNFTTNWPNKFFKATSQVETIASWRVMLEFQWWPEPNNPPVTSIQLQCYLGLLVGAGNPINTPVFPMSMTIKD